jgi:sterol 24-C-methyltransferase
MRNISRFTGCGVTGITLNEYQVKVANKYCAMQGLEDRCKVLQGDFQDIGDKFDAETFDGAYQIEATCHSPNRREVFRGIGKCLKKGSIFCGYEWVVLPSYDKNNAGHVRIKEGIEVGNGLPTLVTGDEIKSALADSGFEVLEAFDANQNQHTEQEIPWYATLQGGLSLKGFRMTKVGRTCTHGLINTLEFLGIAPKGSVAVSALLNATALDLVEGGEKSLFTPSYFFVARKI